MTVAASPSARSLYRPHDRKCFFKYMTAETACLVLAARSLRWSSPVLFNDPFDVPRELVFGVTPDDLVAACGARIASLIEAPPDDHSALSPQLRLVVETIKKGIPDELREQLLATARAHLPHKHTSGALEEFRDMWRRSLPDLRILCLTEGPLHAAMWLHYANAYTGAVLEFACTEELDSAWFAARPVTYSSTKPQVYTADGWADMLCLEQEIGVKRILDVATYTKSPDWSYEAEWRITTFKRPGDTGHYTDYKFNARELVGIYFGPLTVERDRTALMALASAYPDAKVFSVRPGHSWEFIVESIPRS
jgi:hypothetical protein